MAKTLRLILGDQLHRGHSWFRTKRKDIIYVMMEVLQEATYVRHHIQKVMLFFASMRAFRTHLEQAGHTVVYLTLDDPHNQQTFADNLRWLIKKYNCARFEYLLPDEYRLDEDLKSAARQLKIDTACADTEHFFTRRDELAQVAKGKKTYRMELFYHAMRTQQGILMDGQKPYGGRWNYDVENRLAVKDDVALPRPRTFQHDLTAIHRMIQKHGVKTIGTVKPRDVMWPLNQKEARALLDYFLTHSLAHFGTYQDAMAERHRVLFHSRLSCALNMKMLTPHEVIASALAHWQKHKKTISLSQIEGFVRQILGWREYMRGIYWWHMPKYRTLNYFKHTGALPQYYWNGKTHMNCMHHAITQSLEDAYAHHIQRLMITGNFALIAGVHPDEINAWYLGIYIDAIEWVEMPNTRGMSQFADGGIVGSKPYVSSANYINKMSDYCKHCRYDHAQRHGTNACPFNSFYWDFFLRHRDTLKSNVRVAPMFRVLDRMGPKEHAAIRSQAATYRKQIDSL